MNPLDLLNIGSTIIERIWPDPIRQAEEKNKLAALESAGNLEALALHVSTLSGQMAINAKEAEHKSIFVAGWRPFIGWVGGFALAYQFIVYQFLLWVWAVVDPTTAAGVAIPPPPMLEATELYTIITGMLGIGVMRSFDKTKGTATQNIK